MFHIALHFIVPFAVAFAFWRSEWKVAFAVMMATMAVDLDHLLAVPIYDPLRCSIGFHPMHKPPVIVLYAMLFIGSFIIGDAQGRIGGGGGYSMRDGLARGCSSIWRWMRRIARSSKYP